MCGRVCFNFVDFEDETRIGQFRALGVGVFKSLCDPVVNSGIAGRFGRFFLNQMSVEDIQNERS